MIVGGNIDGYTRVMTTAIALETSKGDLALSMALGLVFDDYSQPSMCLLQFALLGNLAVILMFPLSISGLRFLPRKAAPVLGKSRPKNFSGEGISMIWGRMVLARPYCCA